MAVPGSLFPLPAGNLRGISGMLAAGLSFAIMYAAVRQLADTGIHPFEIAFFRILFGFVVVIPWIFRRGVSILRTRRLDLCAVRAIIMTGSMMAHFTALAIAPLTQITALAFSAPIFATLWAVFLLKERVGWRRWMAILAGFAGTLITVHFGFSGFGAGQALVIVASIGGGVNIIVIKVLGRTDSPVTITAYMSLMTAPLALIPALFVWSTPAWDQFAWLALVGITSSIGEILFAQALRDGETNVVIPFDYVRLLWIAAIAFVAFNEVPNLDTWIGGTIIFAATAYIAYRERRPGPLAST